jgi:hypothetical protein
MVMGNFLLNVAEMTVMIQMLWFTQVLLRSVTGLIITAIY